ncbi:MAG: metal-dependent hydrolase [Kofleriaceae bacterium]|nr:metal-dependent hydrolase [Kofleriaceae bacterium]MBP9207918.1 metal-dependent hydrolase [Kofleriaceae bacterium]
MQPSPSSHPRPAPSATPAPAPAEVGRPPVTVRAFTGDFAEVPRHWLAGSPAATHLANGVNLLFPAGERFFVRSVHHFAERVRDPGLLAAVRAFSQQEGRHAHAHDRVADTLRAQGFEIDDFLAWYTRTSRRFESWISPELRLAVTAASEHFTAIMAEDALRGGVIDHADPAMRALLAWHAAEEIEHKAVAFDVLRQVAPSYRLRVTGLAFATLFLGAYWALATRMLLRQDGVSVPAALRQLRALRAGQADVGILRRVFARGIRDYLRRDFHPDDSDTYHLVAAWAARGEPRVTEVAARRADAHA